MNKYKFEISNLLYEVEGYFYNLRDTYFQQINNTKITLKELITYGFNSIRTKQGEYLGYEEDDFNNEQLEVIVIPYKLYTDIDGYTCILTEFAKAEDRELFNIKPNCNLEDFEEEI
ncbi:MAG: hypothetical protein Q4G09_06625 [Clostridia bacterium]|nr:hypothetical protein [Clostridia bacterium]